MSEDINNGPAEDNLEARLFAIEFKLQELERHLSTTDAGQLMQLSRQVRCCCLQVVRVG